MLKNTNTTRKMVLIGGSLDVRQGINWVVADHYIATVLARFVAPVEAPLEAPLVTS